MDKKAIAACANFVALTEATMSGDVTKIAEATAALNDILAKFQRASQEATKLAQAAIA